MLDSEESEAKVILLGESGVGKTNLINITMGGNFNDNEIVSSTSSFSIKKLTVQGKEYTIKLWDTIGQEKLRSLTKLFYNDSKIAIFVYDITRKETFEELKSYWVNDVIEKLGKDIIKGVVANKIDLFLNEKVSREEGEEFASSINAQFLSTSAKADSPVKFEGFLAKLYEEYLAKKGAIHTEMKTNVKTKNKKISLNKNKKNEDGGKGKKCC